MKSISEIAENYNFYQKGDMKRFYRALLDEGYDIASITHNPNYDGMAIAATEIVICEGSGFTVETVVWG